MKGVPGLVLLVLLLSVPAGAVDAPPAAPDSAAAAAVIPSAEIARRAEEAMTALRDYRRRAAPADDLGEIVSGIGSDAAIIDSLQRDGRITTPDSLSRRELEALLRRADRARGRLVDRQEWLEERAHDLDGIRDGIAELARRWDATRDAAPARDLPDVTVRRIDSVRDEIAEVAELVAERRTAILVTQDRATAQLLWLDERAEAAEAVFGRRRSSRETPDPVEAPGLVGQLRDDWKAAVGAWGEFLRLDRVRLVYHVLGFVLLAVLLLLAGRRISPEDGTPDEGDRTRIILRRPVAAAAVVSLLASYWIYADPPEQVYRLVELLLVLPLLRIIPPLMGSRQRPAFYGLLVLLLLERMTGFAGTETLLDRTLQALLAALGTAGAVWVLRRERSVPPGSRRRRAASLFVWLSLAGFVAALAAAVLGDTWIARRLNNGLLVSALYGMVVYAAVLILRATGAAWVRSGAARGLRSVRNNPEQMARTASTVLSVLAVATWLSALPLVFRVGDAAAGWLETLFAASVTLGEARISVEGFLLFGLVLYGSILVSRLLRFVMAEEILPRFTLARGVPQMVSVLIRYGVVLFGFLLALVAAGIELSRITLLASALGVGIGFGLQNIVNNFVSGLILAFERPIQPGDTIEMGTLAGTVRSIGVRSSVVRTFDGADVIVPNGDLIAREVINWTLSDRLRRIGIKVGVAYGTDPELVFALLVEEARAQEDCLSFPEPYVLFRGFGDSSLDFELRFWTRNFDEWIFLKSDTTVAINRRLRAEGVEIPFPQRDLHLRDGFPAAAPAKATPSAPASDVLPAENADTPTGRPERTPGISGDDV